MGDVIHMTEGYTQEGGSIRVFNWTNDNLDRGYPSETAVWDSVVPNKEAFLRIYGKCRTGCLGAKVIVKLDDEEVR